MDWRLGGALYLATVSDGELSEQAALVTMGRDQMLEAKTSDGVVLATKGLTDEAWTLNVEALPDGVAHKILEAPSTVWDADALRELSAPTLPLQADEQMVEFGGWVYVRNNLTGAIRPAFAAGTDGAPADPNALRMSAAGPDGGGSTLSKGDRQTAMQTQTESCPWRLRSCQPGRTYSSGSNTVY